MATKEELEISLRDTQAELKELRTWADKVTAPPLIYVPCISVHPKTKMMEVVMGGQVVSMAIPKGIVPTRGCLIAVSMDTKVPVEVSNAPSAGSIVAVVRALPDDTVEISQGPAGSGSSKAVLCEFPVQPGDLVQLDSSSTVVLRNLGPDPNVQKQNVVQEFQPVHWDEIGGLDDVKQFFFEVLERPLLSPAVYAAYGIPLPKGCLLAGPPGCGKTLIAKAAMTDVLARYQHSGEGAFLMVKGPELLSPWVGVAERNIRDLFERARKFKKENGFPCFIFIDEAEAILNVRGSGRSSDVDRTIIPAFLAEMDGVEDSGALVILATNRPEMLDPAIIREGRIDKKVLVPRPNASTFCRILEINLNKYPKSGVTSAELAVATTEYLFSDSHALYNIKRRGSNSVFAIRSVLSGALGAALVQQAAGLALNRDIARGRVTGLTYDDLVATADNMVEQHRTLNYRAEVEAHIASYKDEVLNLERV